jgi:hypothetical protein
MLDPGADQLLKEEIANASIMGVAGNLFSMQGTCFQQLLQLLKTCPLHGCLVYYQ